MRRRKDVYLNVIDINLYGPLRGAKEKALILYFLDMLNQLKIVVAYL